MKSAPFSDPKNCEMNCCVKYRLFTAARLEAVRPGNSNLCCGLLSELLPEFYLRVLAGLCGIYAVAVSFVRYSS
jgi:hypothetical protein